MPAKAEIIPRRPQYHENVKIQFCSHCIEWVPVAGLLPQPRMTSSAPLASTIVSIRRRNTRGEALFDTQPPR